MKKCILPLAAFAVAASTTAFATDYYVALTGDDTNNDGLSAEAPFATIDKAIATATSSEDVIHVAAGTYQTTTQWGANLKAKLVGTGATRDDVVINSAGTYRTLRMDANSWLEKVTVIGCTDISKAEQPQSFSENMDVARKGGEVAGIARKALEERTGKPVITAKNATQLNAIVTGLIEDAAEKDK